MMLKLGRFKTFSDSVDSKIDLNFLHSGVNATKNHFIFLDDKKDVISVVDRICDHAGGRLIQKGNFGVCPMHGWKLDFTTMKYQDSHVEKLGVVYTIKDDKLIIPDKDCYLSNPFKSDCGDYGVEIRFLNHATMAFSFNGIL